MTNDNYNRKEVEEILNTFLKRDYAPDGRGGLFTVRHCSEDLRDVEIWSQLNWYIQGIT